MITGYCSCDRKYINSEIGSDEKYFVDAPKWRQFIAEDKRAPIVVAYALAGDDENRGYYTAGWYASNNAKSAPEYRGNQSLDRIISSFASWAMRCLRRSFSSRAANMSC